MEKGLLLVSRVLVALAFSTVTTGCTERPPCLSWVSVGETYGLEVMDRFSTPADTMSPPFLEYLDDDHPCGTVLGDDIEGGTIQMTAAAIDRREQGNCDFIEAQTSVPGEVGPPIVRTWGSWRYLMQVSHVRIGECEGTYYIGVMPVLDEFSAATDAVVQSDHMLTRAFFPIVDGGCPELLPEDDRYCTDSWYVRVKDSSGKQLSEDLD